jgi:probable rRNA maturation factor
MIDVVNLQRKVKIDTTVFREFVAKVSESLEEAKGKNFSVAFISDRRMKDLNVFFRNKDFTTDVLAFPHEPDTFAAGANLSLSSGEDSQDLPNLLDENFLGDIVISAEQAHKQAKENKLTLEKEIKQLILHGVLHLCGYDHETDKGEMNRRELTLRRKLKI